MCICIFQIFGSCMYACTCTYVCIMYVYMQHTAPSLTLFEWHLVLVVAHPVTKAPCGLNLVVRRWHYSARQTMRHFLQPASFFDV